MRDPLRAKLNLTMVAALAFLFGLGIASALDLTPPGFAGEEGMLELLRGPPAGLDASNVGAGFAEIVERIAPAVVTIRVEQARPAPVAEDRRAPGTLPDFRPTDPPPERATGSGFLISESGYVVTNSHVIGGASWVEIQMADRRTFDRVRVVGFDPTTDVALLKVDAEEPFPAVALGYSDSTRVGDWVLALGSPGFQGVGNGPLTNTVTAGIVSAKGRAINILNADLRIEDFIQTDAAISRGNSGGPLVNAQGEVIGINTAIASTTGANQGYGFSVPIELVREVIDDLIQYGAVHRALIGVSIDAVTAEDARYYELDQVAGAKVVNFTETSSAARDAGIRIGDLIVGVNGEPVQTIGDLQRRIRTYEPGENVSVDIVRRLTREHTSVAVLLDGAPPVQVPVLVSDPGGGDSPSNGMDALGLDMLPLDAGTRADRQISESIQGAVIGDYDPRGAFARAAGRSVTVRGDWRGFLIVDIEGRTITSISDYEAAISAVPPGGVISMIVYNRLRDASNQMTDFQRVLSVPVPE